jgi:hypothetical protein
MHVSLRERKNTPAHFHHRQPQTRPHALDDQRAEDLQHGVCDGVHATGVRVLVAVHVELFLNVRDVSVGHVALVKVFHEETETADAEDRSIEFQEETLFFGVLRWVSVSQMKERNERRWLVGGAASAGFLEEVLTSMSWLWICFPPDGSLLLLLNDIASCIGKPQVCRRGRKLIYISRYHLVVGYSDIVAWLRYASTKLVRLVH